MAKDFLRFSGQCIGVESPSFGSLSPVLRSVAASACLDVREAHLLQTMMFGLNDLRTTKT